MKKLIAIALCLCLVLGLCACAGGNGETDPSEEQNEIARILNEGYSLTTTQYSDGKWSGLFLKEGSYDVVYRVDAAMSEELSAEWDAIDFFDDDADVKRAEVLKKLTDVQVTDIASQLPSQSDLDAYVGKTIGDMEDEGFEQTGYIGMDGDYTFSLDGPVFCVSVKPAPGTVQSIDDLSTNDIRALVIASIEFNGVSSRILDN